MSRAEWSLPPESAFSFRCQRRTRWSDEDTQGVLNNAIYPTLFEEARLDWSRSLGLLSGAHFPFVLAESRVRFLRPGRGGQAVEIQLATTRVGRSSFEQAYRVCGPGGAAGPGEAAPAAPDELWCEGTAVLVFWDPDTRRATEIPAQVRSAIERGCAAG